MRGCADSFQGFWRMAARPLPATPCPLAGSKTAWHTCLQRHGDVVFSWAALQDGEVLRVAGVNEGQASGVFMSQKMKCH